MKYVVILLATLVPAAVVRVAGFVLWVIGWISGTSDSTSMIGAIGAGAVQGWAMAWPMLATGFGVMGVGALACAAALSLPVLAARLRRRHRPTVFLSYQNAKETLALQLRALLEAQDIAVQFLPFDPAADHDELLARVDAALERVQYVVCLPGAADSFVDAEVLAASFARKSIVFVVDHPAGRLPNTGAKKYPVLMTQALQERGFMPLVDVLRYLYGGWRETLQLYLLPNAPVEWIQRPMNIASRVVVACLVIIFMAMWFGIQALYALEYFYTTAFKVKWMILLFAAMATLFGMGLLLIVLQFLVNGVSGVIRRQHAVVAVRDAIRSGTYTDTVLRAAFEPAAQTESPKPDFLYALWPERPLAHHEARD